MQLEVNPGYATCPPTAGVRLSLAHRRGVVGFVGGVFLGVYYLVYGFDGRSTVLTKIQYLFTSAI